MVTRVELPRVLPARDVEGHKGTYGTVALLAGSPGMLGAAILAARGALRGGAGLVRAVLPPAAMTPFTIAVPSALTADRDRTLGIQGARAIVVGSGLPPAEAHEILDRVLVAASVPLVLDAGALEPSLPKSFSVPVILTPHPGEAARLLSTTSQRVQSDRESAVVELAQRYHCIVVLKGAGTLVCDGEQLYENRSGNPGLGTGGSGDVLAGLLGALLAQGMEPFEAACFGVHIHGLAGDLVASRLSEPGVCAEDLPLAIAEVMGR